MINYFEINFLRRQSIFVRDQWITEWIFVCPSRLLMSVKFKESSKHLGKYTSKSFVYLLVTHVCFFKEIFFIDKVKRICLLALWMQLPSIYRTQICHLCAYWGPRTTTRASVGTVLTTKLHIMFSLFLRIFKNIWLCFFHWSEEIIVMMTVMIMMFMGVRGCCWHSLDVSFWQRLAQPALHLQ